jgi:hypothetical protein
VSCTWETREYRGKTPHVGWSISLSSKCETINLGGSLTGRHDGNEGGILTRGTGVPTCLPLEDRCTGEAKSRIEAMPLLKGMVKIDAVVLTLNQLVFLLFVPDDLSSD